MTVLEQQLGDILRFISHVVTSARMNTAYNGRSMNNPDTPKAAMWLVDILHNFHGIGDALKMNDHAAAIDAIDNLATYWWTSRDNVAFALSVNKHSPRWTIEEGLALLDAIKQSLVKMLEPGQNVSENS